MFQTIQYYQEGPVGVIKLNRPENYNSFSKKMSEELVEIFQQLSKLASVQAIVVAGNGKHFCVGLDLTEGVKSFDFTNEQGKFVDIGGQVTLAIYRCKKPVIAAIHGATIGIGLTMTLPMDVRFAQEDCKMSFIFGKRGIGPEACSGYFLPRIVGVNKALDWLYTGKMITSREAEQAGLIQYVVNNPFESALAYAHTICNQTSNPSKSFMKQLLWRMLGEKSPYAAHEIESQFLQWAVQKEDVQESLNAFIEKREPDFKMRAVDLPDFFENNNKGE